MAVRDAWHRFQQRGRQIRPQRVINFQGSSSPSLSLLRDFGYGTDAQDGRIMPNAYDVQNARIWALSAYGRKYLSIARNNAVGAKGITLLHSDASVQAAWDAWIADCGIGGLPLQAIQTVASDALLRDGEILLDMPVIRRQGGVTRLELAVRDSLDLNYDNGIEINERTGEIVRYIWQDGTTTSPDELAHIYHPDNPKAVRGMTWFKGAFAALQHLNDFHGALVENATATANNSGILILPDGYVTEDMVGDDAEASQWSQVDEDKIRIQIKREAGEDSIFPQGTAWIALERGKSFSYSSDFGGIRAQLLAQIAAAFGVSYHALSGDVSSANFSSLRHGRLEDTKFFERVQGFLARLMDKVYTRWQTVATLTGEVSVSAVNGNEYQFVFPAPEYIEPVKEITADKLAVEAGLNSRTQIIRSRGQDPEQVFAELLAERELLTPEPEPQASEESDARREDGD